MRSKRKRNKSIENLEKKSCWKKEEKDICSDDEEERFFHIQKKRRKIKNKKNCILFKEKMK